MELREEEKEKNMEVWTYDSILLRPFLSTWIATWIIFIGVIILLLSSIFLKQETVYADWTSFSGMVVIMIGGIHFSMTTFINQPLLISLGGLFMATGLMLYIAFLSWQIRDDMFTNMSSNELSKLTTYRANLAVAAMTIFLIGIFFFVWKSIQRFVRPYIGPNNFFLYGHLLFGGGSFCYLLFNLRNIQDVDKNEFHPAEASQKFGNYLFFVGAYILQLTVSRSFYSFDLLIIPSFPSLLFLKLSSVESFVLVLTTGTMTIGGFLFAVSSLLMNTRDLNYLSLVATCFLSIGYLSIAIVLIRKHRPKVWILNGRMLQGFGFTIYTIATVLNISSKENHDSTRISYPDDFRIVGMAMGIIGSVIAYYGSYPYASPEIFSPGNFGLVADVFSFSGFLCLFLTALSISVSTTHACKIACSGSGDLGTILISVASLMYFFYFVQALDMATIQDPMPSNVYSFLHRLKFPFWLFRKVSAHKIIPSWNDRPTLEDLAYDSTPSSQSYPQNISTKSFNGNVFTPTDAIIWETSVLVIGCGPAGLNLANELGVRGISTIVIDSRTTVTPDSRFFNLNYCTTEGLKRLGVLDKIISRSMPQTYGHGSVCATGMAHDDSKVIGTTRGPSRSIQQQLGQRMSANVASMVLSSKWSEQMPQRCMQSIQEVCLVERAREFPHVDVRYGWEIINFQDDSDINEENGCNNENDDDDDDDGYDSNSNSHNNNKSVTAVLRNVTTQELVYVKTCYLVGCDGPSSFVAKTLKVKFDGFANLGQTRTIHFKSWGLINRIRNKLGESFQYHICRPDYGVGWFVPNYVTGAEGDEERWTFFLLGLLDGRQPRDLTKPEMIEILGKFIGSDIKFEILTDAPWFWNLFFARRYVYGHVMICGDACHSWPTFGGVGGNTGYGDATNLAWKLAAVINGWAHKGMLISYDVERRQFGLKMLMVVLNVAPDRSQLMRLARLVKYPWLWWTAAYRWMFAVRGTHAQNQYSTDGIFLGSRYRSHIIYTNEKHQGIPALECPPSRHTPSIFAGGRLPHVRFPDGRSMNDLIAIDGYTLLILDPTCIRVKDVFNMNSHKRNENNRISATGDTAMKVYPVIKELSHYFSNRNIPLHLVNLLPLIRSVKDKHQELLTKLYEKQALILIRPDLYIAWNLISEGENVMTKISTLELQKVAQIACAEIYDEDEVLKNKQTTAWLNRRFITNIQGYRHLHRKAIYFENQDKAKVIQSIAKKNNITINSTNTSGPGADPPIRMLTKGIVWDTTPSLNELDQLITQSNREIERNLSTITTDTSSTRSFPKSPFRQINPTDPRTFSEYTRSSWTSNTMTKKLSPTRTYSEVFSFSDVHRKNLSKINSGLGISSDEVEAEAMPSSLSPMVSDELTLETKFDFV